MSPIETLHCAEGNHEWQRERKRGKKPKNCPEHTTQREILDQAEHMRRMQEAREKAAIERRRGVIREWMGERAAKGCKCKVRETMSLREINALSSGCTDTRNGGPGWVCPHLDKLRRRLGH